MTGTPTPSPNASRRDALLFLSCSILLIAAAIMTGLLIAAHRHQVRLTQRPPPDARRPKLRIYDVRYGVRIDSPAAADAAQQKRARYLAKAQTLRGHWQVWAVEHQDLLRQLKQAQPGDTATLMRVYTALPSPSATGKSGGVTLADIAVAPDDLLGQRHIQFSWQPGPLKVPLSRELSGDPNAQATSDHYTDTFLQKMRLDFASDRDIRLSETMTGGDRRITLWADGRITEMTRRGPDYEDRPEQVVVPAYDFLK